MVLRECSLGLGGFQNRDYRIDLLIYRIEFDVKFPNFIDKRPLVGDKSDIMASIGESCSLIPFLWWHVNWLQCVDDKKT